MAEKDDEARCLALQNVKSYAPGTESFSPLTHSSSAIRDAIQNEAGTVGLVCHDN